MLVAASENGREMRQRKVPGRCLLRNKRDKVQ